MQVCLKGIRNLCSIPHQILALTVPKTQGKGGKTQIEQKMWDPRTHSGYNTDSKYYKIIKDTVDYWTEPHSLFALGSRSSMWLKHRRKHSNAPSKTDWRKEDLCLSDMRKKIKRQRTLISFILIHTVHTRPGTLTDEDVCYSTLCPFSVQANEWQLCY